MKRWVCITKVDVRGRHLKPWALSWRMAQKGLYKRYDTKCELLTTSAYLFQQSFVCKCGTLSPKCELSQEDLLV
jgi:hypothetical protein